MEGCKDLSKSRVCGLHPTAPEEGEGDGEDSGGHAGHEGEVRSTDGLPCGKGGGVQRHGCNPEQQAHHYHRVERDHVRCDRIQ